MRAEADTSLATLITEEQSRADSVEQSIDTRIAAFNPGEMTMAVSPVDGDNTTVTFDADSKVLTGNFVLVLMNGLVQFQYIDYTFDASGNGGKGSVTFGIAPTNGSKINFMIFRAPSL